MSNDIVVDWAQFEKQRVWYTNFAEKDKKNKKTVSMRKTIFQKKFLRILFARNFLSKMQVFFESTGLEYRKQPKFVKNQCSQAKYGKSSKAKTIFAWNSAQKGSFPQQIVLCMYAYHKVLL